MIRPLPYCTTLSHVKASIDTIDNRILELEALRKLYKDKEIEFEQEEEIE
ncbi:hypothetical protein [Sphingobacterium haloxyli]|nr:hypothetical protein [Sphingobacterium haloxyli]